LKVIFVGPPGVGKSCLVSGFVAGYNNTIGVDVAVRKYKIGEKLVKFELWDISASMTFNNKNLESCKNGQIVACVYSANNKNSFLECQNMI
jgi:GTPase SAR1 family protein